jgi:hypothetical protein
MAHNVVWFEVFGRDGAAMRAFYGNLFGWAFDTSSPGDYGVVTPATGTGISGGVGGIPPGGRPHVTFYVETSSLTDSLAAAERLGGKTVLPPHQIDPGTRIALFADPEGQVVGLVEHPPAQA